jgi:hypothetical protein
MGFDAGRNQNRYSPTAPTPGSTPKPGDPYYNVNVITNPASGTPSSTVTKGQYPAAKPQGSGAAFGAAAGGQMGGPVANPTQKQNPYGTESGPGILENWFNQRATGTDPAFEYASRRGMEDLGNRYAAGGSYNSGAARQGESDFMANLIAQREGQLDTLAGGASGEHQGRLNAMFNQGLGLAGGEAGTMGAYDLGAANSMNTANNAVTQMYLNKAGVDSQANQGLIGNGLGLFGATIFGGKKK